MCVPWELNPQPFALLTQCSTTEPQEHSQFNIDFKVRGTEIIDAHWCVNAHLYLVYSYHTTRHQFHQRNSEIVRWLENATHHAQLHTVHCVASASVYSSAAVPAQRIRWSELDFGMIRLAQPCSLTLLYRAPAINAASQRAKGITARLLVTEITAASNGTPEKSIKPRETRTNRPSWQVNCFWSSRKRNTGKGGGTKGDEKEGW